MINNIKRVTKVLRLRCTLFRLLGNVRLSDTIPLGIRTVVLEADASAAAADAGFTSETL